MNRGITAAITGNSVADVGEGEVELCVADAVGFVVG